MAVIYSERKKIKRNIEEIVTTLSNSESSVVDIEGLIKSNGIEILREEMEYGMSGYIEKRESGWVIGINKYDSTLRRRFTLAHEFGHYILHRNRINNKHEDYILLRDNEYTPMEREANEFAAELLMPENKFRNCVNEGITKIKDLAQEFQVSATAIRYRAYKLGYKSRA